MSFVNLGQWRVAVVHCGVKACQLPHNAALNRRRPCRRWIATIATRTDIVDKHKCARMSERTQRNEIAQWRRATMIAIDMHHIARDVGALMSRKRINGARAIAWHNAESLDAKERVEARHRVALPGRVGLEQIKRQHTHILVRHEPNSGSESKIKPRLTHRAHERRANERGVRAPAIAANETVQGAPSGVCLVQCGTM
jgi:hypothetical protein